MKTVKRTKRNEFKVTYKGGFQKLLKKETQGNKKNLWSTKVVSNFLKLRNKLKLIA